MTAWPLRRRVGGAARRPGAACGGRPRHGPPGCAAAARRRLSRHLRAVSRHRHLWQRRRRPRAGHRHRRSRRRRYGARAAGFGLSTVTISGRKYLSAAEIRQAAGIGPGTSLLFLDAVAAREGLLAVPWIADAQVRKLYPDRVDIEIVEREAFAFWQVKGKVQVIAEDGTVIAPVELAPRPDLPLVVGVGADKRAKGIVMLLARFPDIAAQTRAAVLVAERRWNLRMKNGIDVRLPEVDPAAALAELSGLDREKKLLSRDVVAIDLRLPDRITVRLSDDAAKAREEAMKAKTKRKGADT